MNDMSYGYLESHRSARRCPELAPYLVTRCCPAEAPKPSLRYPDPAMPATAHRQLTRNPAAQHNPPPGNAQPPARAQLYHDLCMHVSLSNLRRGRERPATRKLGRVTTRRPQASEEHASETLVTNPSRVHSSYKPAASSPVGPNGNVHAIEPRLGVGEVVLVQL